MLHSATYISTLAITVHMCSWFLCILPTVGHNCHTEYISPVHINAVHSLPAFVSPDLVCPMNVLIPLYVKDSSIKPCIHAHGHVSWNCEINYY
jgi:hypothetical protein